MARPGRHDAGCPSVSGSSACFAGGPSREAAPNVDNRCCGSTSPTGSTIGFAGTYFTTATEPIPLKASRIPFAVDGLGFWQSGNLSRSSTTLSRPRCLRISLRSSQNSRRRNRGSPDGFTEAAHAWRLSLNRRTRQHVMYIQRRHWLDYDPVALAVLVIGIGIIELLALII